MVNLLFYTNGANIYNNQFEIATNGDSINNGLRLEETGLEQIILVLKER